MAEADIPVDLLNPGQVFACLGFMEAADLLLGDAEAGFDWADAAAARFRLSAAGEESPVRAVLACLQDAGVCALAPAGSQMSTEKWGIETVVLAPGEPFPYPEPASPATLPGLLQAPGRPDIPMDHWGDATRRDNVKFWAGSAGYPGVALARDALDLARQGIAEAGADPFALAGRQSSSFRFDWRRDYIPIDAGFSPNAHGSAIAMIGYPLVEVLAAIGLGNARPLRLDKLAYRYTVMGVGVGPLLPPSLVRAALGCADLPFPRRTFRMRLGWPGQEGQARCITDVSEETSP